MPSYGLSCGFCGGQVFVDNYESPGTRLEFFVRCMDKKCRAIGPGQATEKLALKKWSDAFAGQNQPSLKTGCITSTSGVRSAATNQARQGKSAPLHPFGTR
jgi:hypothetical protein